MTKLLALPQELHASISALLPYPDLLALKLTNRYFYRSIKSTVMDRVSWLLDRPARGLPLPRSEHCYMKTDADFLASREIQRILRYRRLHVECIMYRGQGDDGCLVLDQSSCPELRGGGGGGWCCVVPSEPRLFEAEITKVVAAVDEFLRSNARIIFAGLCVVTSILLYTLLA